jgi:carboxymethylenebutenolidase
MPEESLTDAQQELIDELDRHRAAELESRDVEATLKTMVDQPYILMLANPAGGVDQSQVRNFYTMMLSQLPADMEWTAVSRTVGSSQVVIESVLQFTHDTAVDWIFAGIAPTHRKVCIAIAIVFSIKDGKVASERLYWDQASALAQIGLLKPDDLPVVDGAERAALLVELVRAHPDNSPSGERS